MKYSTLAKKITQSEDVGGELVKLLEAINEELIGKREGVLITQAVPDDGGNPVVHIAVFTNKETDFSIETEELYIKWVRDYADSLVGDDTKDIIEDGDGSAWSAWCPMCHKKLMSVVRPGKVQCQNCG